MASHPLKPAVKTLVRTIGRVEDKLSSIKGVLEGIQTTVKEGFDNLLDAVHENTQAQAELKLMDFMADVQEVKPRIEAEQNRIEREKSDLNERLESIADRYQSRHQELNEKANERIRDLGEHIFRVEEEEYEAGVEEPLAEHVTTTWKHLAGHNEETRRDRENRLTTAAERASEAVGEFVGRRQQLLTDIEDCRTGLSVGEDGDRIQVPFYVVEFERSGTTERVVVPPSQLTVSDEDWFTAELDSLPGFPAVTQDLSNRNVPTTSSNWNGSNVAAWSAPYADQAVFGLVSFEDELEAALPDSLPVAEEVRN
jgi:hypothetical protein